MSRPIPIIAALMTLAACAPSAPNSVLREPPAGPYAGGPLIVGMKGIGPIRAMTYFEPPRIRDLFPNAKITEGVVQIDPLDPKDTLDDIIVYDGAAPMLEIDDGTRNAPGTDDPLIGQVRAIGGPVIGPHNTRLGLRWRDSRFDLTRCEIGEKHQRGELVCAWPHEGAVAYIFAIPGWDAVDLPTPSLLWNHGYLREMVWTPPTTRGPS